MALVARLDECGWAAFGSGLGSGGCSNTSSPGTDLTDARLMRQIRDFLEHIDRAAGFLTTSPSAAMSESFRLPSVVNRFGVASSPRVREVADPKCRCAGAGRPRWIDETPRSALPDPCPGRGWRPTVRLR